MNDPTSDREKRVQRLCTEVRRHSGRFVCENDIAAVLLTLEKLEPSLQSRIEQLERALELMPDEIGVFRIMQATGGPQAEMAKAVGRRIEEIRAAITSESRDAT